jgi:GAF domain-containing protein
MSFPRPSNEMERLNALRRYQILDTRSEVAFDDFTQLASTICETPIALVTLVDADRQWFKSRVGLDTLETPREHAFCSYTIMGDDPMIVEDATADERFANNPLVTSAPHIRFYAGAPLIDHEGNALGSLCVIDRRPRQLNGQQKKSLQILGRRVTEQIELRSVSKDLASALGSVKLLEGLIPICSHCKSIREDDGYWERVENYFCARSHAQFSHGICPVCMEKFYPEAFLDMQARGTI